MGVSPPLREFGGGRASPGGGEGKEINEGFDAFVPLVDSGIYIAVWLNPKFLSTIIYTCGEFDEDRAVAVVRDFFRLTEHQSAAF